MMKKRWILLMMCACISGLGGCGKQTVTEKAEETETAYMCWLEIQSKKKKLKKYINTGSGKGERK